LNSGGEASLVVLGDVAGATAEDIEALHSSLAAQGGGVALAASSDGGTSALLRDPPNAIPCCFGPDSAKAHRLAAERAGVRFSEPALASLAIDLDRPNDLQRFLASKAGGARTRALLREWGVSEIGDLP
jgi:2-phospho-L-lactate guanylyltransferase